ncbi:sensor histidine kinase [Nocardioides limicola]|uniref:sensor histidine kinase n=1 Tax=Nocardioides limicola TaxID=2803368 RepID=UPI00193B66DA|nr:ATP-binding protein [Nocardioides sp. DJM-14]
MRRRLTLAGQFLALQLVIIVVVLVAVMAVLLAQAEVTFRQVEGDRMRAVAETGASMQVIRDGLVDAEARAILAPTAEGLRTVSGAELVLVLDLTGRVVAGPEPEFVGERVDLAASRVLEGRAWIGSWTVRDRRYVGAHVPVVSAGRVVGAVAAAREHPDVSDRLGTAAPVLPVYLGVAGILGALGSLLLARRVKRQTLGMEPREITRLVEHREAMLHGIREGVIGLDTQHRVTLVNDAASDLLGIASTAVGQPLSALEVEPHVQAVLTGEDGGSGDRVVPIGDRVVILNRMPLIQRDQTTGSVTTMRDRTDLLRLQDELDVSRTTTEALRAQAHEFSNRLHVIGGLLELEEPEEARRFVRRISGAHAQLSADVAARVADPAAAALLIAKVSRAHEQDTTLRVSSDSALPALPEGLATDLVTVLGNLIDNALDAVRASSAERVIEVAAHCADDTVSVSVSDSGPGVPESLRGKIFQEGFSTKESARPGGRGVGLNLVRVVCTRRGGRVRIDPTPPDSPWGATFTAELPLQEQR